MPGHAPCAPHPQLCPPRAHTFPLKAACGKHLLGIWRPPNGDQPGGVGRGEEGKSSQGALGKPRQQRPGVSHAALFSLPAEQTWPSSHETLLTTWKIVAFTATSVLLVLLLVILARMFQTKFKAHFPPR